MWLELAGRSSPEPTSTIGRAGCNGRRTPSGPDGSGSTGRKPRCKRGSTRPSGSSSTGKFWWVPSVHGSESVRPDAMRVVSVNVSLPKTVEWRGRRVTTAIFKEPVEGRVRIRRTGLVGDRQADSSVHGGPTKAVYAYPSEHYPFWRRELGRADLPWGLFGENLTTEGLDERTLRVGDRLRVGSALLTVTQPRMPCYKLGIRFGRLDMVRRVLAGGRSGFYLAGPEGGEMAAGDPNEILREGQGLPQGAPGVGEGRKGETGRASPWIRTSCVWSTPSW